MCWLVVIIHIYLICIRWLLPDTCAIVHYGGAHRLSITLSGSWWRINRWCVQGARQLTTPSTQSHLREWCVCALYALTNKLQTIGCLSVRIVCAETETFPHRSLSAKMQFRIGSGWLLRWWKWTNNIQALSTIAMHQFLSNDAPEQISDMRCMHGNHRSYSDANGCCWCLRGFAH